MARYCGHVGIEPIEDFAQTAKILGEALGGLNFVQDQEHRFDEFPAFVAVDNGIEYALLGVTDPSDDLRDQQTSDFELQVHSYAATTGEKIDISMQLVERIANDGRILGWVLT
jgi:hypothetical protein